MQTERGNKYLRKFEDTKWAVRNRKSKLKDGSQYNGQDKKKQKQKTKKKTKTNNNMTNNNNLQTLQKKLKIEKGMSSMF